MLKENIKSISPHTEPTRIYPHNIKRVLHIHTGTLTHTLRDPTWHVRTSPVTVTHTPSLLTPNDTVNDTVQGNGEVLHSLVACTAHVQSRCQWCPLRLAPSRDLY